MKVYMDPFVAYLLFVSITGLLALLVGKAVKAETKRIAAKNAASNYS